MPAHRPLRVLKAVLLMCAALGILGGCRNQQVEAETEAPPYRIPYIQMQEGDRDVNRLEGFAEEMRGENFHETINTVDENQEVSFVIDCRQQLVTKVEYELFKSDGSKVYESGELAGLLPGEDDTIPVTLKIKKGWEDKEAGLHLIVSTADQKSSHYYTRLVKKAGTQIDGCLKFALEFSEATRDKAKFTEYEKYLESDPQKDPGNFGEVTIHSAKGLVRWGNLNPVIKSEPTIRIAEITGDFASFVLTYDMELTIRRQTQRYKVTEYIRDRYGNGEAFLLDYHRKIERIWTADDVPGEASVELGIQPVDLHSATDASGGSAAVVLSGDLWEYRLDENRMYRVFGAQTMTASVDAESTKEKAQTEGGSAEGESANAPRIYETPYDIDIVQVEEDGDIVFVINGYMDRGTHAGRSGMALMVFNKKRNTVTEKLFLDTKLAPASVRRSDSHLIRYSQEGSSAFLQTAKTLAQITTESGGRTELVDELVEGRYMIDEEMAALYSGENDRAINLLRLSDGSSSLIQGGEGESLILIGFIDGDFVYGVRRDADQGTNGSGELLWPMYKVVILDENGEVIKEYEQEGEYIATATIEDRNVSMKRVRRDGDVYSLIGTDYLAQQSAGEEMTKMRIESYATEQTYQEVRLGFIEEASGKKYSIKEAKLGTEEEEAIKMPFPGEDCEGFYVYGYGELQEICVSQDEGVEKAQELRGVVTDGRGNYIWQQGVQQ